MKAHPQIRPRLLLVRLVEGLNLRFDQKALPGLQFILGILYIIPAFSFQDVVENIVGADGRTEAVQGFAFCVAAEAEIKVLKLMVRQLQYICIFHFGILLFEIRLWSVFDIIACNLEFVQC